MPTTISSTETVEGVTIALNISKDDLYLLSENQRQMLSLLKGDTIIDQVRLIFILVLEVLSRKAKYTGNQNGTN